MAIMQRCLGCKRDQKVGRQTCKCGLKLKGNSRYRVMVKFPNGKTKTKLVDTLSLAKSVEGKFRTQAVEQGVFDTKIAPTLLTVWNKYIKWKT